MLNFEQLDVLATESLEGPRKMLNSATNVRGGTVNKTAECAQLLLTGFEKKTALNFDAHI